MKTENYSKIVVVSATHIREDFTWIDTNETDMQLTFNPNNSISTGDECSQNQERPSTVDFLKGLRIYEEVLVLVTIIATVITLTAYMHNAGHVLRLYKDRKHNKRAMLFIISMTPITSVVVLACALTPRLSPLADVVLSWVIAMGSYHFVVTLFDHFHGIDKMAAAVTSEVVPVGSAPLCCFYCCCPSYRPTRAVLQRARVAMLQAAFFQPGLALVVALFYFNDLFQKGWLNARSGWMYLTLLKTLSTMATVYGLNVLVQANSQHAPQLHLGIRRLCIQSTMMLFNIQGTILSCLSFLQKPQCFGHFMSAVWIEVIFYCILSVQYAVISCIIAMKLRKLQHKCDKPTKPSVDDLETMNYNNIKCNKENGISASYSAAADRQAQQAMNAYFRLSESLGLSEADTNALVSNIPKGVFTNRTPHRTTYGTIKSKGDN